MRRRHADAAVVFLQVRLEGNVRRRSRARGLRVLVRVDQAAAAAELQDRHDAGNLLVGAGDRDRQRLDALAHPLFEQGAFGDPVLVERGRLVIERRAERELIKEYRETVTAILGKLNRGNLDKAVALASVPEEIRGYGHVKEASMVRAEAMREELLKGFTAMVVAIGVRAA